MPKKVIKRTSKGNELIELKRGVSTVIQIHNSEPFDRDIAEYLDALSGQETFDKQLREIVIVMINILKSNGYPYRPSYKISSQNSSGSEALTSRLKRLHSLTPIDTYFVCGEVIHRYHLMNLRLKKGAPMQELIEHSFKLGSSYHKALFYLKERAVKSKISKKKRGDLEVETYIQRLSESSMTAKEAFNHLIGKLDAKEYCDNSKVWIEYLNENEQPKKMTFKTFENKLSKSRRG